MKREILFRGKRVDNGEWIEGDLGKLWGKQPYIMPKCYFASKDLGFDDEEEMMNNKELSLGGFIEVISETVGQFIGITDKKGIEIFEGDICKCRYYKHSEPDLYLNQLISFEKGSFITTNNNEYTLSDDVYSHCPVYIVDVFEVIGNIHDNPELLK